MGISIGGLASGLDTAGIVDSLIQIEAIPQSYVKQKQTATNNLVSALQALNAKVSSLADNAAALTKTNAFAKWTATSSSTHATATAGDEATLTDLTFKVNRLAQGQSSLTNTVTDPQTLTTDGKFTFTTGAGDSEKDWSVDVTADASLGDIAKSINDLNSGVRATVVSTAGGQRLQLTSATTGAEQGQFSVTSGDGSVTLQNIKTAQDAELELWPGMGLPDTIITSSSNTFTNVAQGVDLTVSKVHTADEDATSVSVTRDDAAISKLASNLVSQVSQVLSEITSRASITVSGTDSSTSGGLFTGDAQTRMLASQISDALGYPVNGKSPSTIGIEIQKDGTFVFNEEKFKEALAADPTGTEAFLAELGNRVNTVANSASDKYEGSITLRIQSQQSLSESFTKQIADWDIRLELRRATLNQTYTAMEVALSKMQSLQSSLAGQFAALSGSSSSTS